MRPEYITAVDAVRQGYGLWLPLLPALLIWYAAIRWKRGFLLFFVAWASCWFLLVNHSNAIQSAKERYAQTAEEWSDWSSDTWNSFAPVTAIPYTLVYCLANAAIAYAIFGAARLAIRFFRQREEQTKEPDYESYRASLVRAYNDQRDSD